MHILAWILPPLLGAIIALATNWIAIVMLFRPHTQKKIFGLRVPFTPGLVPREKAKLGRKLGEAIERHLLTPEVLMHALTELAQRPLMQNADADALKHLADTLLEKCAETMPSFEQTFPLLDEKLEELVRHAAAQSISGLASMFVKKDKIYPAIKEWLTQHLADEQNREALRARIHTAITDFAAARSGEVPANTFTLPQVVLPFIEYIAGRIPIADMVEEKMATYDIAEAEAMILSVVGRELKIIVLLGGVFGFVIGLMSLVLVV